MDTITLSRNADWQRSISLKDNEDNPLDLTGATFDMDFAEVAGGPIVASATVTCDDPENGVIEIHINGSDFNNAGYHSGSSRFVYDLIVTQDEVSLQLFKGELLLEVGVSDNAA